MSWTDAILLGLLQGLTEFLPVSSSGHLALAEALLGVKHPMTVTVLLHAGSLAALLIYMGRDLAAMLTRRRFELGLLLAASIPAAVVGLAFKDQVEKLFAWPLWVCGELVATGLFLLAAERRPPGERELGARSWGTVLWMGLAQAAAILPGISRSGATIGAGYFCGLKRAEAVRFAFLMGIPTIGGAIVLKLKEGVETLPAAPLAAGLAVCFVVSLASLKLLEKLAARGKLLVFSIWCIAVGVAGGVIFFLKERA